MWGIPEFSKGVSQEIWGRKFPSGVQWQNPGEKSVEQSPSAAKSKCYMTVEILTFSCITKFSI